MIIFNSVMTWCHHFGKQQRIMRLGDINHYFMPLVFSMPQVSWTNERLLINQDQPMSMQKKNVNHHYPFIWHLLLVHLYSWLIIDLLCAISYALVDGLGSFWIIVIIWIYSTIQIWCFIVVSCFNYSYRTPTSYWCLYLIVIPYDRPVPIHHCSVATIFVG